jgi:3-hydroxyacyl-[acyl-carrier-protein] dehydratase
MWIDRVLSLEPAKKLVAIKHVSLSEDHIHDHFPASGARAALPVMPMSLVVEGMAQSAGILVGHAGGFRENVLLAKVARAELSEDATAGDSLRYTAEVEKLDAMGASTRGTVELLRPNEAPREIGRVDLMFSHADQSMSLRGGPALPGNNFVFGEGFRTLLRMSGIEMPAGV